MNTYSALRRSIKKNLTFGMTDFETSAELIFLYSQVRKVACIHLTIWTNRQRAAQKLAFQSGNEKVGNTNGFFYGGN